LALLKDAIIFSTKYKIRILGTAVTTMYLYQYIDAAHKTKGTEVPLVE